MRTKVRWSVEVFTAPVDGDGRGVHTDGHGSLLLLEKLSRVSWPLSDDGLRFLETQNKYRALIFFLLNVLQPFLETLSLSSFSKLTSTSDSFLSRLRSSMLGSAAWGEESSDSYVTQSREKLVHLWINQSDVLNLRTNELHAPTSRGRHRLCLHPLLLSSICNLTLKERCLDFTVPHGLRLRCSEAVTGASRQLIGRYSDGLTNTQHLITRFKNWTHCHTN